MFQIKGIAAKIKIYKKQNISKIDCVNIETIIMQLCPKQIN